MILNQAQAEAVYSAMFALNNVNGRIDAQMPSGRVVEGANGVILVTAFSKPSEDYSNQAAFATAYGLISDEPQSDVAAAAGGLTQTACEY